MSNLNRSQKLLIFYAVVTTLIAIGALIAVIILATETHDCPQGITNPFTQGKVSQNFDQAQTIRSKLFNEIKAENIKTSLLTLTKDYHPAGTEANMAVLDFVADSFRSFGVDKVVEDEYEILLSYPNFTEPNTVWVQRSGEEWTMVSDGLATILGPPEAQAQQHDNDSMLWWNAYSPPGNVSGQVVYVNYCGQNDFQALTNLSISANGKLVLCRYGRVFRGDMTYQAEINGAIGVMLYLDPADYGPQGNESADFVFPESIYAPPTAAQRGTMFRDTYGDPQTPLYPAKNYTYRWYTEGELRNKQIIPNIPVTPIGYAETQLIFQYMDQHGGLEIPVTSDFHGGLNVTYFYNSSTNFRLIVNAITERRPIKNIIGYIWGQDEPDKYVMLSNHVDAWTYGAQDPNSGTAIHLEVSRALKAVMNETSWRPRRTIVFCAWDSEEYGLGGSAEWVQEKLKILESRAVALINVDVAISGNVTLSTVAAPLLYRVMINASKLVSNPNPQELLANRSTVYDSWVYYSEQLFLIEPGFPLMALPASGSDHEPFIMYAGVPIVEIEYSAATPGNYPLYHTMYEIEWMVENLLDLNFRTSIAVAQIWVESVRNLADSLIIPFNVTDYGIMMIGFVDDLDVQLRNQQNISAIVDNYTNVITELTQAAQRFLDVSLKFQQLVDHGNSGAELSVVDVDTLNNRLMNLEKAFIDPRGIPEHPHNRHVVFSPSEYNVYSGSVFSGVLDSLQSYYVATNDVDKENWRKMVNLQITVITLKILIEYDPPMLAPEFITTKSASGKSKMFDAMGIIWLCVGAVT